MVFSLSCSQMRSKSLWRRTSTHRLISGALDRLRERLGPTSAASVTSQLEDLHSGSRSKSISVSLSGNHRYWSYRWANG